LATSAVILLLWWGLVYARSAIDCPDGCRCDKGDYYVKCQKTSLTTVPLISVKVAQRLKLDQNNITLLERNSFLSLTELEILQVHKCGLRTIKLGAFNGLTKLKVLSVINNELSGIIPGTFESMSSLEILDLRSNKLEYLDSHVFSGLVKLKYIFLDENKLQYLHPDTFLGLPNLRNLTLYTNPDLQIPTDSNFIKSHSLSHLDISNCNVSSLSVETFANVSALEWLGLGYNKLRNVDVNILRALPKLSAIYLEGNPLQCDCRLQEVWRWCEDRNIQTGYRGKEPKCDTPSEVEGISWGVLDKGLCLQGYIHYYGYYKITG
jgi:Leucine-rich repeat (LRR) protein